MPYVEQCGVSTIKDQLEQWKGVMHDPNIDGFNGWACKQKILKVLWAAQEALVDSPEYAGQEEWIEEQKNPVLIYESPDKGKTVYARRLGDDISKRFLVKGDE